MSNEDFNTRFLAWFSFALVFGILVFIAVAMFGGIAKADDPVAMLVIGGLMGVLTLVVGYWFGSSAGSKRAADRLAAQTRATTPSGMGQGQMQATVAGTRRDRVRGAVLPTWENDCGKEFVMPPLKTPGGTLGVRPKGATNGPSEGAT